MRCAGSSVFGTSSRTGFLAEESREFRRTGRTRGWGGRGPAEAADAREEVAARSQKDVCNL